MDLKQPSKRVEFLYLQQEDRVKAGGLDMKETMKASKPVSRRDLKHGSPNG